MFRTLGDVLQTAVARGMVDLGEPGVGAPSQPPKGTASAKPAAKSYREVYPSPPKRPVPKLVWSLRCKPTHVPSALPPRRVGFHLRLVVDNLHHATPF